jgi:hypothetical protein
MHPSAGGDMRTQCRGQSALEGSLRRNVLSTDDVVAMVDYLVERNPELLSSRDQDGALPRVADFSTVQYLVNLYKAYVKSVTSEGDLQIFLAHVGPCIIGKRNPTRRRATERGGDSSKLSTSSERH